MIIKIKGHPPIHATSFSAFTATAVAQIETITTVSDVSGSLNNKYFFLPNANTNIIYVVYLNVDGAGVDPNIQNTTSVSVAVSSDDTSIIIAGLIASAITALSDFSAVSATNTCTITHAATGGSTGAQNDDNINATNTWTGFTFAKTTPGTPAVPSGLLYEIQGKYFLEKTRWNGNILEPERFYTEDVTIIVTETQIMSVSV